MRVVFARKGKSAQPTGLLAGDGVQERLKGKEKNAVDMVLSFVALFTDRSLGFKTQRRLTRVSKRCMNVISRVPVDCRDVHWLGKTALTF